MTLLEQLQELAPLAAAATPGPWGHPFASAIVAAGLGNDNTIKADTMPVADTDLNTPESFENAAFIAYTRNLLTPENLTLIIGLLGNMESVMETNRVLVYRQLEIQNILEFDLHDDTKLFLISETINPAN